MWKKTYLAVVAVDEKRIVLLLKNQSKNRLHDSNRNCLLLRSHHLDDMMADAILLKEGPIRIGKILVDQCAVCLLEISICRLELFRVAVRLLTRLS